ncbi:uncharacterized protein IAS62_006588 [Cryptococcus decagattii]|uniref:Protein SMG7 n=1 Tax=Cryptococcus decagattii TaxID=1859122 RepID=A0ABZ2B334_9TREE
MQSPNTAKRAAAALDSEAKSESDRLRNVLGSQPPWSKEVELHRQQCRSTHLTLLFSHPFSPYSQSLDLLWLHTTYILIQAYRDLISRLERLPPAPSNSNGGNKGRRGGGGGGGGNAELKKALTKFRQVLTSEETFYRSLVARLVRFYNLGEVSGVEATLKTIKLPTEYTTTESGEDESSHAAQFASLQEKKDKILLLYKGLICLGDLERYKEQYKQPANNNRHAQERERQADKFEVAENYYLAAWSLMPDDGAAWNQLAVISTYIHNDFSTTYYYYRALAVKNAFQGADGILQRFFGRIFDKWRAKRKEGDGGEGGEMGDGVEKWKEEMVVLMAILYLKAGFTYIPTILPALLTSLKVLLRERRLPTESIVRLTSILLGSHFRARSTSGLEQDPNLLKRSFEAEGKTLEVALEVWKVYLQVAREEVEEARASLRRGLEDSALLDDEDEEELETDEMPQLISAILRRILPSLRIISKWLKLNTTYLSRLASPSGNDQVSSPELRAAISSFWDTYHAFFQSSSKLFILERLPSITRPLEEDLDMRGFAPLQKGKTADIDSFAAGATSAVDSTDVGGDGNGDDGGEGREVHPNEEHLMRLGDIQVDGLLIGQSQGYADPLHTFTTGTFTIPEATEMPNVPRVEEYEREHDLQSISTNTEDDPVNLAMRASLGSESVDEEDEEDEEEVIVWNRGRENAMDSSAYQQVQTVPAHIASPMVAPPPQHRLQHQQSQTAMDLLQDLLQSTPPHVHSSANNSPALVASPYAHQSPSYTQTGFPGMNRNISGPSAGIPFPHNTQMPPGMTAVPPSIQSVQHPGQAKNPSQVPSLFLGSQGSSIWTMTREESQKGHARAGTGPGMGMGMGMGWVGVDEGQQASQGPPPGFAIPQVPPPIGQPLAQMHQQHQQQQLQAHVPMQNIANMGGGPPSASATLQAQATLSRPSPGPVAPAPPGLSIAATATPPPPGLTHRPSIPKLHPNQPSARQTPPVQVQVVQHPTRQPRGPSVNAPATWGMPLSNNNNNNNMNMAVAGMSNVPLPPPKSEVEVPYYMRPGVFGGGGAGVGAGAGAGAVGGTTAQAGAGGIGGVSGGGVPPGRDGAGQGQVQGIWDGTRGFGKGQG